MLKAPSQPGYRTKGSLLDDPSSPLHPDSFIQEEPIAVPIVTSDSGDNNNSSVIMLKSPL